MSLVAISLFSADDKYEISVTWVSSTDGSTLATAKLSSPSTASSLLAEYESASSQFLNLVSPTLCCVISIPSSFPADECFDVLHAFTAAKITPKAPLPPITHGQAYCATLPDDNYETFIMFLDFSPSSVSSECLLATFDEVDWQWQRSTNLVQRSFAAHGNAEGTHFQDALIKVAMSNSEESLDRIVLNNPPPSLSQLIYATLSTLHPKVPVTTASQASISSTAATYEYIKFNFPRPHYRLGRFWIRAPVSVATSTGAAVCLVPRRTTMPVGNRSIILTTSMDDQRSATVRLLLGNHRLAKDNRERDVAVLTGLVPMAKGTARIEVSIEAVLQNGWRDAAVVVVRQLTNDERKGDDFDDDWDGCDVFAQAKNKKAVGLTKAFMFPRFFNDISDSDSDDDGFGRGDNEDEYDDEYEGIVGALPL